MGLKFRKIMVIGVCFSFLFVLSCCGNSAIEKGNYEIKFQQVEGDVLIYGDAGTVSCSLIFFVSGDVNAFEKEYMEKYSASSLNIPSVNVEGFETADIEIEESTYRHRDKACYSLFFDLIPEGEGNVIRQIDFAGESYTIGKLNIEPELPEKSDLQVQGITGSVCGLGMQPFNLTLRNQGDTPVTITSIDYGSLENLKGKVKINGQTVESMEIAAGSSVKIEVLPTGGSAHKAYYLSPKISYIDGSGIEQTFTAGTVLLGNSLDDEDVEELAKEIILMNGN